MESILIKKPITQYAVSGVWLEAGQVTHYAIHQFLDPGLSGARRFTKAQAIRLVERSGVSVYTMVWDYREAKYEFNQLVRCVDSHNGKFLWTEPKLDRTKNLRHLVNFSWLDKC